MAFELTALAKIVSESVAKIEAVCAARSTLFPSLHTPFTPESEVIRSDPEVSGALLRLVAAADQLVATASTPPTALFAKASAFHFSSAIRVACYANVAEVLRIADRGLHVDEIAKHSGLNPNKLGKPICARLRSLFKDPARILRLLATHHVFRELSPDVFCNNRLSFLLDTGKSLESLRTSPETKYENTNGFVAFMEHGTNLHFKSSAFLLEAMTNHASRPAFNVAFNTELDLWRWMELPENLPTLREFGVGMNAGKQLYPESSVLEGFDWKALPEGSLVVDVGGGVGSVALTLARALPKIQILIQDRDKVVEEGKKFWSKEYPGALNTHRVDFQVHDFFEVQPATQAAIFFLHFILHDWPDADAEKILRRLRTASRPETRLIVSDFMLPYACEDVTRFNENVDLDAGVGDGSVFRGAPLLIPNLGVVNATSYMFDLSMLTIFDGAERTLGQFKTLLQGTGWNIIQIYRAKSTLAQIVAVPI